MMNKDGYVGNNVVDTGLVVVSSLVLMLMLTCDCHFYNGQLTPSPAPPSKCDQETFSLLPNLKYLPRIRPGKGLMRVHFAWMDDL